MDLLKKGIVKQQQEFSNEFRAVKAELSKIPKDEMTCDCGQPVNEKQTVLRM